MLLCTDLRSAPIGRRYFKEKTPILSICCNLCSSITARVSPASYALFSALVLYLLSLYSIYYLIHTFASQHEKTICVCVFLYIELKKFKRNELTDRLHIKRTHFDRLRVSSVVVFGGTSCVLEAHCDFSSVLDLKSF